jgi:hypothetical protein
VQKNNEENKMNGKINISKIHTSSAEERDFVSITIEDAKSGVTFFSGEMELSDFAKAVMGQGYMDITFKLRRIDLMGKTREYKKELVYSPVSPVTINTQPVDGLIDYLVSKYEIDGWKANRDDFSNYHNYKFDKELGVWIYTIGFTRFVESNPTE